MKCPECNSGKLVKFGFKWCSELVVEKKQSKKVRVKRQQYLCNDCGRITVKPLECN